MDLSEHNNEVNTELWTRFLIMNRIIPFSHYASCIGLLRNRGFFARLQTPCTKQRPMVLKGGTVQCFLHQ